MHRPVQAALPLLAAVLLAGRPAPPAGTRPAPPAQGLPALLAQSAAAAPGEPVRRLRWLLSLLTATLLLLLAFTVGAYLIARLGRALTRHPSRRGRRKTTYSDAWAGYRLSEEDIARATAEPGADGSSPRPPADDDGEQDSGRQAED